MINVTKEQIELLRKYVPSIDELVQGNDVKAILDAIDDVIIDGMLGNNDEPTDSGIMLQRVYDQVYDQN